MEKRNFGKMILQLIIKLILRNILVPLCDELSGLCVLKFLSQINSNELQKGSLKSKSFNHSIIPAINISTIKTLIICTNLSNAFRISAKETT